MMESQDGWVSVTSDVGQRVRAMVQGMRTLLLMQSADSMVFTTAFVEIVASASAESSDAEFEENIRQIENGLRTVRAYYHSKDAVKS